VATVNPGDHTIEIRKDRFKAKQIKRHFVVGSAVSLATADAALDAAPGELKITFTPADAQVTLTKEGETPTKVSSGGPLSLAAGSYTLTAKTADNFSRSATMEVTAGQSRNLDLSLAPDGISKFDDPSSWKQEKGSFRSQGWRLRDVQPLSYIGHVCLFRHAEQGTPPAVGVELHGRQQLHPVSNG